MNSVSTQEAAVKAEKEAMFAYPPDSAGKREQGLLSGEQSR